MVKENDFSQLTFSPFKNMDERRQLTILISCLSSILTSALLLLRLQAVIALKIAQQQSHLCHLQNGAIMSRNNALARYIQQEKGLQFSPSKRCCKIATFFSSESMYLFKKINVFCVKIYSFITAFSFAILIYFCVIC